MSEEKKDLNPFNGSVYRCGVCGAIYNTVDYSCPVCASRDENLADIELAMAAFGFAMDEDSGEWIDGNSGDGEE